MGSQGAGPVGERSWGRVRGLAERPSVRWIASYLAGAWLLLEVLDVLGDVLGLPPTLIRWAAVVLAAGFPASLVLARWSRGRLPGRATRHFYAGLLAAGMLTIAAVASGISMRVGGAGRGFAPRTGAALPASGEPSDSRIADQRFIAVLPFAHIGGEERDRYFADGVHEEILTALAGLDDLHVISRASVLGYRDAPPPLDSIARALGVGSVLTGSVRRGGDRVRISLQLVNPLDGQTLWASSYDRPLDDVLQIQSDVAAEVAGALRSTISAAERRRLGSRSTRDPDAYDLYLRARERIDRPGYEPEDLLEAERLYVRAIDRDPSFALAHAQLANLHVLLYRFAVDPSETRAWLARATAERALRLDPTLPEAHLAMGYYWYQVKGDLDQALLALERAREIVPRDASVLAAVGYVKRRRGRFAQALEHFEAAARQDPLNPDHHLALATTSRAFRRYEAADRAFRRMASVSSDPTFAELQRGYLFLLWKGDPDTLRRAVAEIPPSTASGTAALAEYRLAMVDGRPLDAARALAGVGPVMLGGTGDGRPAALLRAWALEVAGERAGARLAYQAVRDELERPGGAGRADARIHASLALALAGLERDAEAVEHARLATRLEPESENAMYGPGYAADLAAVLARTGASDEAFGILERLLRTPGGVTAHQLRLEPQWAPLRAHAGFAAFLEGASRAGDGAR